MLKFFHGLAIITAIGGAFLIGCTISFLNDPWDWIKDFWFPILLISAGIAVAIRDARREKKWRKQRDFTSAK